MITGVCYRVKLYKYIHGMTMHTTNYTIITQRTCYFTSLALEGVHESASL